MDVDGSILDTVVAKNLGLEIFYYGMAVEIASFPRITLLLPRKIGVITPTRIIIIGVWVILRISHSLHTSSSKSVPQSSLTFGPPQAPH
jgi:hypothetical protein